MADRCRSWFKDGRDAANPWDTNNFLYLQSEIEFFLLFSRSEKLRLVDSPVWFEYVNYDENVIWRLHQGDTFSEGGLLGRRRFPPILSEKSRPERIWSRRRRETSRMTSVCRESRRKTASQHPANEDTFHPNIRLRRKWRKFQSKKSRLQE